jgi:hypothetical protein
VGFPLDETGDGERAGLISDTGNLCGEGEKGEYQEPIRLEPFTLAIQKVQSVGKGVPA